MTSAPHPPGPAPRGRQWPMALGAALLLGLLVLLTPPGTRGTGQGAAFLVGHAVGVTLGALCFCAAAYGVLRLAARGRTPPAFATVAFWTLLVDLLLHLSRLVGSAGPPG